VTALRTVAAVVLVMAFVAALLGSCDPTANGRDEAMPLQGCTKLAGPWSLMRCVDREAGVACWINSAGGMGCLPLDETDLEGWRE